MTLIDRARRLFDRRPEGTPGQLDQERETAVSLGLMADAKAAGAEMTDEQAIFLSSSIAGMNARIAYLRGPDVPKPLSLAQERELTMIERELARLEGRDDAAPVLVAREGGWSSQRFLGPLTGSLGLYGALAAGVGVIAILGWWRLEVTSLKHQRDRGCLAAELQPGASTTRRPCVDLGETQRMLEHNRAALREATSMVRAADENAMRTAETLRRLEQQRATRAAQQRRTQRELEALRNGLGEPPELGLHDAQPTTPRPGQN